MYLASRRRSRCLSPPPDAWDRVIAFRFQSNPTTKGPSWGYSKVNFTRFFGKRGHFLPKVDKSGQTAPRTGTGCPHEGPFVVRGPEYIPSQIVVGRGAMVEPNSPSRVENTFFCARNLDLSCMFLCQESWFSIFACVQKLERWTPWKIECDVV